MKPLLTHKFMNKRLRPSSSWMHLSEVETINLYIGKEIKAPQVEKVGNYMRTLPQPFFDQLVPNNLGSMDINTQY